MPFIVVKDKYASHVKDQKLCFDKEAKDFSFKEAGTITKALREHNIKYEVYDGRETDEDL